jgi:hypothetical protein
LIHARRSLRLHICGVGQANGTNIPSPFGELANYPPDGVIAAVEFQLAGHINDQVEAMEFLQSLF